MSKQVDVANGILDILQSNGCDLHLYADMTDWGDPYLLDADTDEPVQSLAYDSAESVLRDIVNAIDNRH